MSSKSKQTKGKTERGTSPVLPGVARSHGSNKTCPLCTQPLPWSCGEDTEHIYFFCSKSWFFQVIFKSSQDSSAPQYGWARGLGLSSSVSAFAALRNQDAFPVVPVSKSSVMTAWVHGTGLLWTYRKAARNLQKIARNVIEGHSPTLTGSSYNPLTLPLGTKQVLPSIQVCCSAGPQPTFKLISHPSGYNNPGAEAAGLAPGLPCTLRTLYFQLTCDYKKSGEHSSCILPWSSAELIILETEL